MHVYAALRPPQKSRSLGFCSVYLAYVAHHVHHYIKIANRDTLDNAVNNQYFGEIDRLAKQALKEAKASCPYSSNTSHNSACDVDLNLVEVAPGIFMHVASNRLIDTR